MRAIVILLIVCCSAHVLSAQSLNDFRSAVTVGNWNINTSWQVYNGTAWVTATNPPTQMDNVITIQAGNTISFGSDEIVDQVVVNGTLKVPANIFISFPVSPSSDVITVNGTLDITGGLVMNPNSIVRVNGTIIGEQNSSFTGNTASNLLFQSGSTYQHSPTTGGGTIPTAGWNMASTVLIKGGTAAPSNLSQTFGNFTYDIATTGTIGLAGALNSIAGNFTTAASNQKALLLAATAAMNFNVGGDMIINSPATLTVTSAGSGVNTNINITGSFTQTAGNLLVNTGAGNVFVNVSKNFTRSAGTFGKAAAGSGTVVFNCTCVQTYVNTAAAVYSNINFQVNTGSTLDLGSSSINGGGNFTLPAGAFVKVGSTNAAGAIVSGATGGNINVTGSRVFATGSTIIYGNSTNTAQFIGTGTPTVAGITTVIDNTGGVKLASNLIINGDIVLTNGNLDASNRQLTLGGTLTPNANGLAANSGSTITINDASSNANFNLKLAGSSVVGNLIIGGAPGRNVLLGADLAVSNNLTTNSGTLQLNGFTLDLQGGITQSGGSIVGSATSGLMISDESGGFPLPSDITISGGLLKTITMNRLGTTLSISSPLVVHDLILLVGNFAPGPSFKMATGGKITVTDGKVTAAVSGVTSYDVEYNSVNPVTTGLELPATGTTLNSLINSNTASVTLSAPATVNGSLILNAGTFNTVQKQLTLRGDFISNAASLLADTLFVGSTVFDGSTTLTGTVTPQFGTITINPTKTLAVSGGIQLNVGGDFIGNGTFTPGQSTVYLNGSVNQNINAPAGTARIPFYQLEIYKKTGNVNILDSVDIQSVLGVDTVTQVNAGTNFMRLISTASMTARVSPLLQGANITGSVIAERFFPTSNNLKTYRYLTPVVTGTTVQDWQNEVPITGAFSNPSTGPGIVSTSPTLFYYDESNIGTNTNLEERYVAYPTSGLSSAAPLVNGRGYALYVRQAIGAKLDSRGTLAQHQITVNVTNQSGGALDGWNLIGNPYASPVAWSKVSRANVPNAMYIRNNTAINTGNGIISYVNGVSSPNVFDGTIDSGQGFWVRATANGSVTFNETDKVISADSTAQYYRTEPIPDLLRITIAGNDAQDETVIRFSSSATDQYDPAFDAEKMPDPGLSISSSLADGTRLVINSSAPLACDRTVALHIANAGEGNYSISAAGLESFSSSANLILIDQIANQEFDLRSSGAYSFYVSASDIPFLKNRFLIQAGKSRLLTSLAVTSSSACFNDPGMITVKSAQSDVQYQAIMNGHSVTPWVASTGQDLQLEVLSTSLKVGLNNFKVLAKTQCASDTLDQIISIKRFAKPSITNVTDGAACPDGVATIKAVGALAGQFYNFYNSPDDIKPFTSTALGELIVKNVKEDRSYFAAVTDSLGCESSRVEIKVTKLDSVRLSRSGNDLTSSYASGNQWYFNGSALASTDSTIRITKSGTYTVKVSTPGCRIEASSVEIFEKGIQNAYVYPNPSPQDFSVYFENYGGDPVCVKLITMSGAEIYKDCFDMGSSADRIVIPAKNIAPGIYLLRISIGNEVLVRKVIKE